MELLINTISQNIEIKCTRCNFKGSITATRQYYINCPECDELIYVGRLTKNNV